MTPAEVLLAAADRVQFQGWTQGHPARNSADSPIGLSNPKAASWCAMGALRSIQWAINNQSIWGEELAAEVALLDFIRSQGWVAVAQWNDAPGRTAGEVADTMRRVAKELSNGAAA